MKIFSWNVNGIRAVIAKGEFKKFIDECQPDVLCLQETKAKKGQAQIDLPDYQEFWNDADRAGYSGTAVFVKNDIARHSGLDSESSKKINVDFNDWILNRVQNDKYGDLSREGRITALDFRDFYLVAVYTPNAKPDLERLEIREKWDKAFLEYVKKLEKTKPVIFCGDLNVAHKEIDLANPKANEGNAGFTSEERKGFQNYIDAGFVDTFRAINGDVLNAYTWWTWRANARERNVGWRIDYFMASSAVASKIIDAKIYQEQMGSDHCPVSITKK